MKVFNRVSHIAYLILLLFAALIVPAVHAQDTSDQILYAVANNSSGNTIYTVNVDEGLKTQIGIIRRNGSEAGWSPGGKYIYLSDANDNNQFTLTLIDAKTNHSQTLSDHLKTIPCSLPFSWSPNDEWLAYTAQSNPQPLRKLFNTTTGEMQILTDADLGYDDMVWSPDSRYVAYRSPLRTARYAITVRDVQNQKTVAVLDVTSPEFPPWSPTGNHLVFGIADLSKVVVYNIRDNTQQEYDATHIGSWSPDGRFLTLYLQDQNGHTSLSVVDVLINTTVEWNAEITSANVVKNAAWSFDGHYLAIVTDKTDQSSERTAYILELSKKRIQPTSINPRDEDPFIWSPILNHLIIITDIDFVGEAASFSSFWMLDIDHQQERHYDVKIPPMSYERAFNRSANGRFSLLMTDSGLAVFDWKSNQLNPLDTITEKFSSPSWSRDGMKIAANANRDIYVIMPEGDEVKNMTNTPTEIETFLGWRGAENGQTLNFCGEG